MTSRERVRATVAGLPVDRIPVMTWLNPHAGCRLMAEFVPASDPARNAQGRRMWQEFRAGEGSEDERSFPPILYTGYVNREYALDLGADLISVGIPLDELGRRVVREGGAIHIEDTFGSVRRMASVYLEVVEPAVKDIHDLVELPLPDSSNERPFDAIRRWRAEFPDACLYGESFGVQDLPSTQLWEMSQFMLALYDHPEEVKKFQARFNEYNMDLSRQRANAVKQFLVAQGVDGDLLRTGDHQAVGHDMLLVKRVERFP